MMLALKKSLWIILNYSKNLLHDKETTMPPRKKKEVIQETTVVLEPIKQYEIDWNKIAEDVRAAAELVKEGYPPDDGPLTKDQIRQIKESAPKPKRSRKK
jgi:hypothetical protein